MQHRSHLSLMTAEDPSHNPHLHRRLAAAGRAFKNLLPARRRPGSMQIRTMIYCVYVVPSLLYAVPETSCLIDQPLVSALNAYMRRVTGWAGGRMAPCTSSTKRNSHAWATWLGCLMSLFLSSCCLLKGWWAWVAWSAGHAPHGGIGL
eukprot:362183-Chlamydomonas_euryale.AAC.2